MRKAKPVDVISTSAVCFVFWLVVTGQITAIFKGEASWQILIAGVIVCVLAGMFSARFFIHENAAHFYNPRRIIALAKYCLVTFPIELWKASWDMAKRCFSPVLKTNPGIVKVPVDLNTEYGLGLLADSITLTPGTITMDVVEEEGKNYMYIHWIDVATADPSEAGDAIKGTLEKGVKEVWE